MPQVVLDGCETPREPVACRIWSKTHQGHGLQKKARVGKPMPMSHFEARNDPSLGLRCIRERGCEGEVKDLILILLPYLLH